MFLDIGVGIFIAILVSELFDLSLTAHALSGAIIFSLLPDLDYILYLLKDRDPNNAHRHRDLLHYPILYISLGIVIISFFDMTWLYLFGLCSLAHFLHDSIGIGWGVQWLYPFNKNHYAFFYRYVAPAPGAEPFPRKIIYIWKHDEIDILNKKYGNYDFLKNIYYNWHPIAIVEFLTFIKNNQYF